MRIEPIARAGAEYLDFQPYVPAIDDAGRVVFQATLLGGGSGVFLGEGGASRALFLDDGELAPCSHPDRNDRGEWAVYACRPDGSTALLGLRDGRAGVLADGGGGSLRAIGPLGPVIDAGGRIAFRAETSGGQAAVCTWLGGALAIVATTGAGDFSVFHGLPVTAGEAGLLFRADRADGREGLYRWREGQGECLALTGEDFGTLSAFPAMNTRGDVAFGAIGADGIPVLVLRRNGAEQRILPGAESGIRRFRGALLAEGGALYCTADTADGGVAVFAERDGALRRLLGTGDRCLGGIIAALALNPVSVNASGQLAIRLHFADRGQAIVRLSPAGATL